MISALLEIFLRLNFQQEAVKVTEHIFVKDKDPWIDIVNKEICFDKMYDRENTWSEESLKRLENKTHS